MLTDLQKRKFKREFETYDANGDGILEKKDFDIAADKLIAGLKLADGDDRAKAVRTVYTGWWQDLVAHRDSDGDKRLDFDEWMAHADTISQAANANYEQKIVAQGTMLFHFIDFDSDGKIDASEFGLWLGAFGVSSEVAQQSFAKLDREGQGFLSQANLTDAMREFFVDDNESAPGNWLFGPL